MEDTLLEPNKMILKYLTVAEREGMSKPVQLCQKFDKLVLTKIFPNRNTPALLPGVHLA